MFIYTMLGLKWRIYLLFLVTERDILQHNGLSLTLVALGYQFYVLPLTFDMIMSLLVSSCLMLVKIWSSFSENKYFQNIEWYWPDIKWIFSWASWANRTELFILFWLWTKMEKKEGYVLCIARLKMYWNHGPLGQWAFISQFVYEKAIFFIPLKLPNNFQILCKDMIQKYFDVFSMSHAKVFNTFSINEYKKDLLLLFVKKFI